MEFEEDKAISTSTVLRSVQDLNQILIPPTPDSSPTLRPSPIPDTNLHRVIPAIRKLLLLRAEYQNVTELEQICEQVGIELQDAEKTLHELQIV
jgi:hypothetical protein